MGCSSCSSQNGKPNGCRSNGTCGTGGCNRMNTYDWLAMYDIEDPSSSDLVEVSFKHGAKKEFFWTGQETGLCKGEYVVVDSGNGWDIGEVSLTGPLVEIQMKKKHVSTNKVVHKVMRRASNKDVERLEEARQGCPRLDCGPAARGRLQGRIHCQSSLMRLWQPGTNS